MPVTITSTKLREWSACQDGYRWFLTTFPAGEADYQAVLDALADADRPDDASWLMARVGPTSDILMLEGRVERKHLFAAGSLYVGSLIVAGRIEAGEGIEAGLGIEAGEGIKAGWGIEAGEGITCSLSIRSQWISARLRIFAGLVNWRAPDPSDDLICAEVRSGTVAFGRVVAPAGEVA